MTHSDICFVRAKLKRDYVFDGIAAMGYPIFIPYRDKNLFLRLLREIWFRLQLPGRRLFYNPRLKTVRAHCFIVKDPLITPDLLRWLRTCHPNSRILLEYDNRAEKTLPPETVPPGVEKWSFDPDDCQKYGMGQKPPGYLDVYRVHPKPRPIWDILYVGRDKGRAAELLRLERSFQRLGLSTCFHICADRRFLGKRKRFYKPLLSYEGYLSLLENSRAIVNIMPENYRGITQRELECVFHSIKCFTNNRSVREFPLYDPRRFFILGQDDWAGVLDFLNAPFPKAAKEELAPFSYRHMVNTMRNS